MERESKHKARRDKEKHRRKKSLEWGKDEKCMHELDGQMGRQTDGWGKSQTRKQLHPLLHSGWVPTSLVIFMHKLLP